jgi:predicted SnoaL-like aldol condensation-catalyzing enzyme
MHNFTKSLVATLALATWLPAVKAILPGVDSVFGVVQQRPYCPARPASPEFQRAAFTEFVNEFFNTDSLRTASLEDFVSADYIQHNPYVLSGRNNTIAFLGNFFDGANFTFLQLMFDSPYGSVHYKVEWPDQPTLAIVDIWRFNGTCIEEHWDVIESLPANATNPIALF